MFFVNVKRILRTGFVNFWRQGYVSLASVMVMIVTLFVISSIILSSALLSSSLELIKNKVDINVYFVTTAPEEDILLLKKSLEALPEVASIEYTSKATALENFKKRHEGDELTLQALQELNENPLGAVLNIRAKQTSQYETIAKFLESKNTSPAESIIDKVNYYQNKTAIDKLSVMIDSGQRMGAFLTLMFVIISILITFNTIRLAIYISREEISIMKLVGASNMYIRGPFVVGGIMYGIFSAVVTLIVLYPITYWLGPATEAFFGGINIFSYYIAHFAEIFFILFGAGIFIGAVSSYLAVRKYLSLN